MSIFLFSLLLMPLASLAGELRVAVAANFRPVLEKLAEQFQAETGNKVYLSSASTGVLYNQITYGAPFDLLLAADDQRPQMLEEKGLAEPGTRTPYAYGRLVLWHRNQDAITLPQLRTWQKHIAIANPVTAPYGRAADNVLKNLLLQDKTAPLLVTGANILQAYQYVASGNVELGFVAYAQLVTDGIDQGIYFIPEELYEPLRQEAVILKQSKNKPLAGEFLTWLQSPAAQRFIQAQGYYPAHNIYRRQKTNNNPDQG